jgi:hypothetical protein
LLGADHRARPNAASGAVGGRQGPRVWKPWQGFRVVVNVVQTLQAPLADEALRRMQL